MGDHRTRAGKKAGDKRNAQAKAMLEQGVKPKEVQEAVGLGRTKVWEISAGRVILNPKLLDEYRAQEVSKLTLFIDKGLDAMADEDKLEKASLQQAATAVGISIQNRELLSGNATQRIEYEDMTDDDLIAARRKYIEELAELVRCDNAKTIEVEAGEASE